MLGRDPVKRGLNGYPYCSNNPVNYVDPTGEVFNILGEAAIGTGIGGLAGFAGSAVSQLISGDGFDWKKAVGSAVNGAIIGGVKGAMIGSGAGLALTLASDLAAGAAGSALEQLIGTGDVSVRKSLTDGVTNALTQQIYGNDPFKSLGSAIARGAGVGAASSGIRYLSEETV